jgi:hypothetical protein
MKRHAHDLGQGPGWDGGCRARADAGELDAHLGYKPGRRVSWCDSGLFLRLGLARLPQVRTWVTNSS